MKYAAIWIPRSVTHFREVKDLLTVDELADDVNSVRIESDVYTCNGGTNSSELGCIRFEFTSDGDSLVCRYTQIGLLVIEGPDDLESDRLSSIGEDLYVRLANQRWDVLAEQIRLNYIPFGKTTVTLPTYDPKVLFEQACYDYLNECVDRSRAYDLATDSEEITDLLQRINQAEACYEYMDEIYGFDNPDLCQHLTYTHNLISMLYQNVDIKSKRYRQRQLRNLQIMAIVFTIMIISLEIFMFLHDNGYSITSLLG